MNQYRIVESYRYKIPHLSDMTIPDYVIQRLEILKTENSEYQTWVDRPPFPFKAKQDAVNYLEAEKKMAEFKSKTEKIVFTIEF